MDDTKKVVESLDELFAAGDAWLRKYGMVTKIAHNAIVTNLYVHFPKVKYLEYFLPEDAERRKVWVVLYVPFWKLLFMNRDKMVDDVIDLLREYLHEYDIRVELKRYKRGVEKANEIPTPALDHVAAPTELPTENQPASGSEPAPATGDAPGADPKPSEGAPTEPGDQPKVPVGSDPGTTE